MDNLEADRKDISDWLLMQSPIVQKNSTILSFKEGGVMLHIDKNVPKTFIPRMPTSAAPSENDTTARITVAPDLVGCIIGYARVDSDVLSSVYMKTKGKDQFKGGYIISEMPYTHCIKPTDKLVYDSSRTLEHWLVSYNKQSLQVKPIEVGKIFISSILTQNRSSIEPIKTISAYISHTCTNGLRFSKNNVLPAGYYKADIIFKSHDTRSVDNESDFIIRKCNTGEYTEAKNQSAALLSYATLAPEYLKW